MAVSFANKIEKRAKHYGKALNYLVCYLNWKIKAFAWLPHQITNMFSQRRRWWADGGERCGQCDNVIELERQEQIWKMIRSRCLDGVAKTNRVLMQELTTLWRDNMVAVLSRAQLCLLYICSLSERVIVMASILEILPCTSCNKLSNSDFYWRHTVPKIIWVSAKNRASHFWSICNVMYEYMTGF